MNIFSKQQISAKYSNYMFVNTLLANPAVKTVSKFILYKTWNGQLWNAEVIDDGNAFSIGRVVIKVTVIVIRLLITW